MALLEKLGIRRKSRPVGSKLETGFGNPTADRRRDIAGKVAIFLILATLAILSFRADESFQFGVEVGDTWTRDDVVAPFSFALQRDPADIAADRQRVKFAVPPLFRPVDNALLVIDARRDTLRSQLDRVFAAYGSYRLMRVRGQETEAAADSARYLALRRAAILKATPQQWSVLVNAYASRVPGIDATSRYGGLGPRLDVRLLNEASDLASTMARAGVVDIPMDSIYAETIVVRDVRASSDREVSVETIQSIDESFERADQHFARVFPDDSHAATVAGAMFRAIFQYSYEYMEEESLERWRLEQARVSPTEGLVGEGEVVVRSGDRVTPLVKRKLASLEESQARRTGNRIGWKTRLGQVVVILATFVFFFLYLFFLRRKVFDSNRMLFLVALLFAGIIGLYAFALRTEFFGLYIVPVAIVSILLTVIFDSRVGLFGTLTLALIGALLLRYNFEFAFATMFAGSLGIYSVRDIKNRGQFFLSSGIVFLGYATILVGSLLINNTSTENFLSDLLQVGVNSFLLIIAYPLLWVFERSFDITTDLTLLELSDTNRPLLKELSLKAPGTLNHTLQVANLAEAAADRVHANALLARVGALYHDIGKMAKPEYFVENQRAGANPHDGLKPRMSALIIASHVKEGLEIGKAHNLPQRVLDFIPMHHGTSLIEYFYRRAVDEAHESGAEVSESEFRYPGPKPNSREAGILMLADSVEAASRSITHPTHKRFENLIDSLFKSRMEDGQLDDVDLTLRELNVIKETFLNMLVGMHHVRVKYPGQEQEEEDSAPAEPKSDSQAVIESPSNGSTDSDSLEGEDAASESDEFSPLSRRIE